MTMWQHTYTSYASMAPNLDTDTVIPPILYAWDEEQARNVFINWLPTSAYDRFIYDPVRNEKLTLYANKIYLFTSPPGQPMQHFFNAYKVIGGPYTRAKMTFKLVAGGRKKILLAAQFINCSLPSKQMWITTQERWAQGSSLSHVDHYEYWNTSEFLMTEKSQAGVTLDQMISLFK